MSEQGIDYTGIAKRIMFAAGVNEATIENLSGQWTPVAREAVAAYLAQRSAAGMIEVHADDLTRALTWHTAAEWSGATDQDDQDARDRIFVAVNAHGLTRRTGS